MQHLENFIYLRAPNPTIVGDNPNGGKLTVLTPPPPQPHPGAAGRKSGKSCRDLAKCLGRERRGPSGGIP